MLPVTFSTYQHAEKWTNVQGVEAKNIQFLKGIGRTGPRRQIMAARARIP
jgi:hypothetical protein